MENAISKKQRQQFIFFSILGAICLFSLTLSNFREESDFLWHVKLGEWMIQNKQIMRQDVFSWVSMYQPLDTFNHSWAGTILVSLFYDAFKNNYYPYFGSIVFQFVFHMLIMLTILGLNKKDILKMNDNILICVLFVLLPLYLTVSTSGRPYMVGFLCYTIMLWMFKSNRENPDSKAIYFIPILSCIWANFHGGMAPIVILFCIANLVLSFINFDMGMISQQKLLKKQQLKLVYATIGSIVGMLINPYGYRIFTYMFLENSSAKKDLIMEFQAASLDNSFVIELLIIVVIILVLYNKKTSLNAIMPLGATALFTLLYIRGVDYFGISLSYFLLEYIRTSSDSTKNTKNLLYATFILATICCIVISIFGYQKSVAKFYDKEENGDYITDSMIEHIKSANFSRMYNHYNEGGELIFHDIPVFIDSRADLYPDELLQDGKYLPSLGRDPEEMLSKYQFDGLLIRKDNALFIYMSHINHYELVFEDKNMALFRVNGQDAEN